MKITTKILITVIVAIFVGYELRQETIEPTKYLYDNKEYIFSENGTDVKSSELYSGFVKDNKKTIKFLSSIDNLPIAYDRSIKIHDEGKDIGKTIFVHKGYINNNLAYRVENYEGFENNYVDKGSMFYTIDDELNVHEVNQDKLDQYGFDADKDGRTDGVFDTKTLVEQEYNNRKEMVEEETTNDNIDTYRIGDFIIGGLQLWDSTGYGTYNIAGALKSKEHIWGKKYYDYVQIEIPLMDSNGRHLGIAFANTNNLSKGQQWDFIAPILDINIDPDDIQINYDVIQITAY